MKTNQWSQTASLVTLASIVDANNTKRHFALLNKKVDVVQRLERGALQSAGQRAAANG
ncbi:MAG: hypothetical protein IPN81_13085 [Nitrosomonadales bacterium]|nr:hypothetical protein [Nitrosomonadales bacterium]